MEEFEITYDEIANFYLKKKNIIRKLMIHFFLKI